MGGSPVEGRDAAPATAGRSSVRCRGVNGPQAPRKNLLKCGDLVSCLLARHAQVRCAPGLVIRHSRVNSATESASARRPRSGTPKRSARPWPPAVSPAQSRAPMGRPRPGRARKLTSAEGLEPTTFGSGARNARRFNHRSGVFHSAARHCAHKRAAYSSSARMILDICAPYRAPRRAPGSRQSLFMVGRGCATLPWSRRVGLHGCGRAVGSLKAHAGPGPPA